MQDKTYKGTVRSIDAYDDQVSLWNLVGGNGLKLLQQIADTECLIEKRDRPLSILLSGKHSTTLYSMCFLRALAMQVSRISAPLLYLRDGLVEFFIPSNPDKGYVIEDIELLNLGIQSKIIQIIENGDFTQYDSCKKSIDSYPVFGIVIFTCKDIKRVIPQLTKSVNYIVNSEDLTKEQIREIIRMRFSYANVGYENEKVIDMLATGNSIRTIVSILKIASVGILSENRSCLTEKDVLKARECL